MFNVIYVMICFVCRIQYIHIIIVKLFEVTTVIMLVVTITCIDVKY